MADIRPDLLDHSFKMMNKGYTEHAQEVLRLISSYLQEDKPLPEEVKKYLIDALISISLLKNLSNSGLRKSLKLNGRKKIIKITENIDVAKEMHFLISNGCSFTEAVEKLSKNRGQSIEKIREAYYQYKSALEEKFD